MSWPAIGILTTYAFVVGWFITFACHALRLYNRAGGKVVRGLDDRRRAEEKFCLEGL